jgi:hypothetical protein
MSAQTDKPPKIGTEITVRISLTFQEAPDVHTLLAMTPVRERGKLVRLALERYIAETSHPAGDVEQQIHAISTWLRSRGGCEETTVHVARPLEVEHPARATSACQVPEIPTPGLTRSDPAAGETAGTSSSIKRWLQV